ncbi:MAG TPA: hypothetical protein PLL19_06490, partial [Thiobacillaceae bacterium]|nr:hypothetical protein [Thiobacillaceae bacterium]
MDKVIQVFRLFAVIVTAVPSGSVAETVMLEVCPSAMVWAGMGVNVGGRLAARPVTGRAIIAPIHKPLLRV